MSEDSHTDAPFGTTRRKFLTAAAAAGVAGGFGVTMATAQDGEYGLAQSRRDAWWYSRYNAESLVLSENGVVYPRSQGQREQFDDLRDRMREEADLDERPVRALESFTIGPYVDGSPSYTERPVFNPRVIQDTLLWEEEATETITPQSLAWTGLAYTEWAKGYDTFGNVFSNPGIANFWAQMFGFTTQWTANYGYLVGGEGILRDEDREEEEEEDELYLFLEYDPQANEAVEGDEEEDRPMDYAATLWYFSELTDFIGGNFTGVDTPESVVDQEEVMELADMTANTVFGGDDPEFSADEVFEKAGARGVGVMLSAVAAHGVQTDDGDLRSQAAEYANELAAIIVNNLDEDGEIRASPDGADEEEITNNQAAVQGAVGQGLLWASNLNNVNQENNAQDVIDYLLDDLWDPGAGTFDDGRGENTFTYTTGNAGDVVGGLNAAINVLDRQDAEDVMPEFFNNTVNRARLQRAERTESRDAEADFPLPLPANAGGEFGEAPVFNAEVSYDVTTDEWEVTSEDFDTEQSTYATTQFLWIGLADSRAFPGNGVPGRGRARQQTETPTETPGTETETPGTPTETPGNETPTETPGTPTGTPGNETPTGTPGNETPTETPGTPTETPGGGGN